MKKNSRIYIAGNKGLIGSALERELIGRGFSNIIVRTSEELDLTRQSDVEEFFSKENPDYVFLCAARVGGKAANTSYPAEFIHRNLEIQTNVIHNSFIHGTEKLVFLGSNCMYPREAHQPYREEDLMTGKIEGTNEPFGIAKTAGVTMCQAYNKQYRTNFISVIPASQYGPNDNFSGEGGHLLPDLIRKIHEAKVRGSEFVQLHGTGEGRREVMYVDDTSKALLFLTDNYDSSEPINVGVGYDHSIKEIAEFVREVVGFQGEIRFETGKKTGVKSKILDNTRIKDVGWKPKIGLHEGLRKTYEWFLESVC